MKYSMTLIGIVLLIVGVVAVGQTSKDSRPGDEPYTPTKLEWAALELQSDYGNSDPPITVTYTDSGDGRTVICVVQYLPDVPAASVRKTEDTAHYVFNLYARTHGWTWMKLKVDEHVLR